MKPPPFDYETPRTVDEATALLAAAQDGATVLAGGQSLIPLLNMRFARPDVIVDINRVAGLDRVVVTAQTVSLGALVRLDAVERHAEIAAVLPVLCSAASHVAHPQIRVRTTVGGTLSHADPSAEMPTVAVALGAEIHLRSSTDERVVAADDFFESVFSTTKRPDELLVRVDFPVRSEMTFVYDEIARRHGDFPFAGLCVGVHLDGGVVTRARAAAAGVGDVPVRLSRFEQTLTGHTIADVVDYAAAAAADEVDPPSDIHGSAEYRRALIATLVRRTLATIEENQ